MARIRVLSFAKNADDSDATFDAVAANDALSFCPRACVDFQHSRLPKPRTWIRQAARVTNLELCRLYMMEYPSFVFHIRPETRLGCRRVTGSSPPSFGDALECGSRKILPIEA